MKRWAVVSPVIVISFSLVVLLGYFVENPLLQALRGIFLQWAVILAGIALLVGIANLFVVHWRKAASGEKGSLYSIVTVFSLVITAGVVGWYQPTEPGGLWVFNYIQVPVEASLMAILAVVLIFTSIRMVRRRMNLFSIVFIATALVMILGAAPLLGVEIPLIHGPLGIRALIAQVPATAGARGLLIGVALGTIATGLRVLVGADRPYGG
jgi:hypothetical protein